MRALITGASGFAGAWLAQACAAAGDEVIGVSRSGALPVGAGEGVPVDLRDPAATRRAVRQARPDAVYHLAALSSVGRSWEDPARTVHDNVATATSVLEALRLEAPGARVVWVSSCEVYGSPERLPVSEDAPVAPVNPYAVSKATGDLLAGVYAQAYDLDIVRVRPFSHAGPRQLPIFIVSSLARQAAVGAVAGAQTIRIVTGNPDVRRDFTDVRDVVRAYRRLAEEAEPGTRRGEAGTARGEGRRDEPGRAEAGRAEAGRAEAGRAEAGRAEAGRAEAGIYIVSSGRSVSATEQVQLLSEILSPIRVEHVVDPDLLRAHETMDLRGSSDRLRAATGWQPQIPLRQTMIDTIRWWERELTARA